MKKILIIIVMTLAVNIMFAQSWDGIKLDSVCNPSEDTVLVALTVEEPDTTGLINSFALYIAFDANVLFAGDPGTPVNLVNVNPAFPLANYLTNIFFDYPVEGWNTIAIVYASSVSGTLSPGTKLFDIEFYYYGGSTDLIFLNEPTFINGYVGDCTFYGVTFHVTADGNDLEGAMVTVGNDSIATNSSGMAVFNLPDGDYTYTVTKTSYADEEGTFTVTGTPLQIEVEMEHCWDVTIHLISCDSAMLYHNGENLVIYPNDPLLVCLPNGDYILTIFNGVYLEQDFFSVCNSPITMEIECPPLIYPVTFFVNCCSEPLEDILLTIGTETFITSPDGFAVFNLPEGDYAVEIGGFGFTFWVPETNYVDADICSEITFHVTDEQGNPIQGVDIEIDGENLVTGFNGEADICLQAGAYSYTATKFGYITQTGSFEVDTIPQTVEIVMQPVTYAVTFICSVWCENQFNGWWLSINGEILNPGETIYLPEGEYVCSCGYLDCTYPFQEMIIIYGPTILGCEIIGFYEPHLQFQVSSSQGGYLQGAIVEVDTFALVTNYSGEAQFCLPGGNHSYSISKEGFDTLSGIFNYSDYCQDTLIGILMNPVSFADIISSDFRLYPNPSDGKFYLENLNITGDFTEISVMDVMGRLVYQNKSVIKDEVEIDLTGKPKGMYFVRVKKEEEFLTRKIVIQ